MDLVSVIDAEVLRLHGMYVRGEDGGKRLVAVAGPVKIDANLRNADLSGANLSGTICRIFSFAVVYRLDLFRPTVRP